MWSKGRIAEEATAAGSYRRNPAPAERMSVGWSMQREAGVASPFDASDASTTQERTQSSRGGCLSFACAGKRGGTSNPIASLLASLTSPSSSSSSSSSSPSSASSLPATSATATAAAAAYAQSVAYTQSVADRVRSDCLMVRVGGPGYGWSILPMTGVRIATARDGHALHGHTLLTWADADLVRCPLDQALVQSSGALVVDVVLRAKANTKMASSPRSVNWNARGSTEVRGEQEES